MISGLGPVSNSHGLELQLPRLEVHSAEHVKVDGPELIDIHRAYLDKIAGILKPGQPLPEWNRASYDGGIGTRSAERANELLLDCYSQAAASVMGQLRPVLYEYEITLDSKLSECTSFWKPCTESNRIRELLQERNFGQRIDALELPVEAACRIKRHRESEFLNFTLIDLSTVSPDNLSGLFNALRWGAPKLRELSFKQTWLGFLPASVGNLTKLRHLDVSDNVLTSLPKTIGHLKNLEILDLSNNALARLPDELGSLTSLDELRLHNNPLLRLPETFNNLRNLRELSLFDTLITQRPALSRSQYNESTPFPNRWRNTSALREVFLNNPEYLENDKARKFIYNDLIPSGFRNANQNAVNFTEGEVKVFISYCCDKIELEPRFFSENSVAINQFLYRAATSKDEEIRNKGKVLFNKYMVKVPALVAHYVSVYGPDPGITWPADTFIFVSPDEEHGMVVSQDYYERFLLGKKNDKENWPDFLHSLKKPGGRYEPQNQPANLDHIFSKIAVFKARYETEASGIKFSSLLDTLNLAEYDHDFRAAIRTSSYSGKFITLDHIDKLQKIFAPLMTGEEAGNLTITAEHLQSILHSYECEQRPAKEQAILLLCLSAVFARYSSSHIFGTESDSPIPVRNYALALLNKASEIDSSVIDAATLDDYRTKFGGVHGAFSCTAVLSKHMQNAINENPDPRFKQTLKAVKPLCW